MEKLYGYNTHVKYIYDIIIIRDEMHIGYCLKFFYSFDT